MRVVLCQMKNGLPSLFAWSMKRLLFWTSTSSNVSMSYFALRPSCQPSRPAMFGNGASGPSSTIRCLPTLPQRGITVGSSVSVAQAVFFGSGLRDVRAVENRLRNGGTKIAEELVEPVHRRQELVKIAQMVH